MTGTTTDIRAWRCSRPATRLAGTKSVHQDVSEVIFSRLFLLITFKQVLIQVARTSRSFFREHFILQKLARLLLHQKSCGRL